MPSVARSATGGSAVPARWSAAPSSSGTGRSSGSCRGSLTIIGSVRDTTRGEVASRTPARFSCQDCSPAHDHLAARDEALWLEQGCGPPEDTECSPSDVGLNASPQPDPPEWGLPSPPGLHLGQWRAAEALVQALVPERIEMPGHPTATPANQKPGTCRARLTCLDRRSPSGGQRSPSRRRAAAARMQQGGRVALVALGRLVATSGSEVGPWSRSADFGR